MTAFCCDPCPLSPSCPELLAVTFARPEDITAREEHLERGNE